MFIASFLIRAQKLALVAVTAWGLLLATCNGQEGPANHQLEASLALNTEAVSPSRFIAAHGRRALIDGYASGRLEIWAYPFQILSGYRVAFLPEGATTPIRGQDILSRVTYEPESITRTYLGPGFIVRETLFVPLDRPGAIVKYKVEGGRRVDIEVHATPVLNLMWPAGVGGQNTEWNAGLSAFVLSEPADAYSAVVGSPEVVAHDDVVNRAVDGGNSADLGFTLRPDRNGAARVFVVLNPPHVKEIGTEFRALVHDAQEEEGKASAHVHRFLNSVLHVETPDAQVNKAIVWAEIALDQAWVCNVSLGCGFVGGYGPSRGARRPQYDWFFAGDGLVAADASLAMSDFTHAREELEFIFRYQDEHTGMIWHELSQSAGLIDWAGKFPYMFVHVDITFQFLASVEKYVTTSGDTAFAKEHWKAIESAYRYCGSLIDRESRLPHIPTDKEGGDEQDRIADDLGLSTSWVQAASAFAHLAELTGHSALVDEARRASQVAADAIPSRYWDDSQSFWVSGHTPSGQEAPEQRSSPTEALAMHVFSREQNASLLDRLATSSFQTDWGTRGVGADSPGFDPASYAKGSVWALGTSSLATAFWSEHRPSPALALWNALVPWSFLDSLGHMHEVLAGDFYRPQTESVPEQTWSSAGFLDATIHGLLGLNVDSESNRLTFAPRLPAKWSGVSVENVRLSNASIALRMRRSLRGLTLEIENSGATCKMVFSPQIPLGAYLNGTELNGRQVAASLETHPQETDVTVQFDVPQGRTELSIKLRGGVSVSTEPEMPMSGGPSTGPHLIEASLAGNALTLVADVPSGHESHVEIQTEWTMVGVKGAKVGLKTKGITELDFDAISTDLKKDSYHRIKAVLELRP